jgi:hypothetical protein
LLCAAEIRNVPVDSFNQSVGFVLHVADVDVVTVLFIQARIQIIDHFFNRTTRDPTKTRVFDEVPTTMPFGDVVCNGKRRAPHLYIQRKLLAVRQTTGDLINLSAKNAGNLIEFEVVKPVLVGLHLYRAR